MTKRLQIKQNLTTLNEIDDVMSAMKNLAMIEMNKLNNHIDMQSELLENIDQISADFFCFANHFLAKHPLPQAKLYLLIGSERGFCGGFNDYIAQKFKIDFDANTQPDKRIIIIGRKLFNILENQVDVLRFFTGATVLEELPEVLSTLLDYLKNINEPTTLLGNWHIIHNQNIDNQLITHDFNLLNNLCCNDKKNLLSQQY